MQELGFLYFKLNNDSSLDQIVIDETKQMLSDFGLDIILLLKVFIQLPINIINLSINN